MASSSGVAVPEGDAEMKPGEEADAGIDGGAESPSKRIKTAKEEETPQTLEEHFGVADVEVYPADLESRWTNILNAAAMKEQNTVVAMGNEPMTAACFVQLQQVAQARAEVQMERRNYQLQQSFQAQESRIINLETTAAMFEADHQEIAGLRVEQHIQKAYIEKTEVAVNTVKTDMKKLEEQFAELRAFTEGQGRSSGPEVRQSFSEPVSRPPVRGRSPAIPQRSRSPAEYRQQLRRPQAEAAIMVWELPPAAPEAEVEEGLAKLRALMPEDARRQVREVRAFQSKAGKVMAKFLCAPDADLEATMLAIDVAQPAGGTVIGTKARYLRFSVASDRGDPRPRNLTNAAKEVLEDGVPDSFVVVVRGTRLYLKRVGEEAEHPVGSYDSSSDSWQWRLASLQKLVPALRAEDVQVYA